MQEAMQTRGLNQAEVARRAGVDRKRISGYALGRGTPLADTVLAIADALKVEARWLIRGEGMMEAGSPYVSEDDGVRLAHYDLFEFESAKHPKPIEYVSLRRAWLMSVAKSLKDLWVTEMPSDAMATIAAAGAMIICRDPDQVLAERRVYAFLLNGRPIIRRVKLAPDALILEADNPEIEPIRFDSDASDSLIPIGRVLAAINLQAV
jgi:transcriptional regulator with XRE-family HTH domain